MQPGLSASAAPFRFDPNQSPLPQSSQMLQSPGASVVLHRLAMVVKEVGDTLKAYRDVVSRKIVGNMGKTFLFWNFWHIPLDQVGRLYQRSLNTDLPRA